MNRKPLKRTPFVSKPKPMKRGKRKKASALTKNAEGQECTLRLPGCLPGTETVVFAHYRRFSWGGQAMKPNDLLGCFACTSCHDKQEHYHEDVTAEDMLRAMGETLMKQERDGIISIGESDD